MSAVLSEVTSRIASLTSIARTKQDDTGRRERHENGKPREELVAVKIAELRKTLNELEKATL